MSDTVVLPNSPVAGPQPGDLIAGKYRLERELGRGAMGTVWAAAHVTLGQRVAIKLIAREQSGLPEARRRFSLEAKAAARLRSRHVVQVFDDGETPDGTPYIVMEYLEGRTLEERLDGRHDMGLAEAVRITTHVGRALARAHAQGVVHRDLKSGNVFIARTDDDELGWVAKVLDFGVAKLLTDSSGPSATKTGTIVGTPLFMSPEQIRGASHVDHRADLYSLGMVFYNMVTGSHAFDGPSYSDVLVAICTEALPDIRVAAPWLPSALSAWFDKACARDREQRFQSADEMLEALAEAAGPAARSSRPSVPDEVGGPSGTLVGHVSPDTAATLLAGEVQAIPVSVRKSAVILTGGDAVSRHSNGGTLRSEPTDTETREGGRAPSSLWLWAAGGVGLAVAVVLATLLATRLFGAHAERSASAPEEPLTDAPTTDEPAARVPSAIAPATAAVAEVATPPPATVSALGAERPAASAGEAEEFASPTASAPSSAARLPAAAPPATVRASSARPLPRAGTPGLHPPSAPGARPPATGLGRTAAPARATPRASAPPPAPTTPDMGF